MLKYSNFSYVGENSHDSFKVIEHIKNGRYKIRFFDGWETTACPSQLKSGVMKSPYYPTAFKVGFIGVGEYKTKVHKKAYQAWNNLLRRCYNEDYKEFHLYGKRGVKVVEDWHNFQKFARWYESNIKEGHHIDKDIKGNGLLYSPDNCTSLPSKINSFISNTRGRRVNNLYTGVYLYGNKYKVHCCQLDGKPKYLGLYSEAKEAYDVYEKEKIRLANILADTYKEDVEFFVVKYLKSFSDHIRKLTVNPYTDD